MKSKTLKALYAPSINQYVENVREDADLINFTLNWKDSKDYSNLFFLKRWFLRIKLSKQFDIKLVYKNFLVFE